MDERGIRAVAYRKLWLSVLAIGGIFVSQIVAVIVVLLMGISDKSLWTTIIPELFGAIAALALFVAIGGRRWVGISRDDIAYAMRYGWWCLAVSATFLGFDLWDMAANGAGSIAQNWPQLLAETALMCLLIGIFEECVFRGIVFNGLLAVMGGTHAGVMKAIVGTSLLFGAAHVDLTSDFSSGMRAVQAILKITETGMFSVLLCTIALRTRRLAGVSLLHALSDFLLVFPSTALHNEPLSTEYVLEGSKGFETIVVYLVVIALYLPFLIKSLLDLHRCQDVTRGAYLEAYVGEGTYGTPVTWPVAPAVPVPVGVPPQAQEVNQPQPAAPVPEWAPYQQQEVFQPRSASPAGAPAPYVQQEIAQPAPQSCQPDLQPSQPEPQPYQPQPYRPEPYQTQPYQPARPVRDGRPPAPAGFPPR